MSYAPAPARPVQPGYTWGDDDLIEDTIKRGYLYFVQYSQEDNNFGRKTKTDEIFIWLNEQGWVRGKEYNWVGGRFYYEICFREEEHALLFKLAYGT